ncbi:hypothetical protein XFF6992_190043 [Xanthomonas citri pv. fuscans]|nr:hypothetical protein XFF6992_190043 [Xanthomonas citri pv. fuscans]SOO32719.1 hypothetical protein XFF6994_2280013 [Xanthomonas citri pv. fuscans]
MPLRHRSATAVALQDCGSPLAQRPEQQASGAAGNHEAREARRMARPPDHPRPARGIWARSPSLFCDRNTTPRR